MLEITPTEKIVQEFLIYNSFSNLPLQKIYEIVSTVYSNIEMSFEEFEEAFDMLFPVFAEFNAQKFYSSKSEIVLFRATTAELKRLKAFKENVKTLTNAPTVEALTNLYLYDDVRSEELYHALDNRTDYTLKLVSTNRFIDEEVVVYRATYAELQEQLLEAAMLIEKAGKHFL